MDSDLTTGGAYVTADIAAAFKGYYRSGGGDAAFTRPFLKFDGEGDTANARERAIGGHPAVLLRGVCRRKEPGNPHADADGYVPFGKLVNYEAGRSDGCTSWSPADAESIMAMVSGNPTTLYIYPESRDIDAVARAVGAGEAPSRAGLYWNAVCLRDIGAPRFWGKETLEPILGAMARGPSRPAAAAAARLQRAVTSFRAKGRGQTPHGGGAREATGSQGTKRDRDALRSCKREPGRRRMPGDPQRPVPTPPPDVIPNPVHPPTPQEAPKSEPPPDIPAPGPDVIREPGPDDIPETFPPEAPPPVTFAV